MRTLHLSLRRAKLVSKMHRKTFPKSRHYNLTPFHIIIFARPSIQSLYGEQICHQPQSKTLQQVKPSSAQHSPNVSGEIVTSLPRQLSCRTEQVFTHIAFWFSREVNGVNRILDNNIKFWTGHTEHVLIVCLCVEYCNYQKVCIPTNCLLHIAHLTSNNRGKCNCRHPLSILSPILHLHQHSTICSKTWTTF